MAARLASAVFRRVARVDVERFHRQGFPEAVFCPGKTIPQILAIVGVLAKTKNPILLTRATPAIARSVRRRYPAATFHPVAHLVTLGSPLGLGGGLKDTHRRRGQPSVVVVTGGTADQPMAEEAAITAEVLGCRVRRLYDVGVAGIHRLYAAHSVFDGARAVIVCAGMEGALASVVGGLVACPVIGVPTPIGYGASLGGIAPLLTMLNSCAANVAVVNIGNGFGAGVIASLIAQPSAPLSLEGRGKG
ncbi:MAG: nickel pincer cofactor biosynthesis protein LarB [Elusimicrobia bacterium]|nr:nickel pincer cofactor biosynthesis protein LarB [Elusimicrobiota bacterium]